MAMVHLGDLLVRNGVLTRRQRDEALEAQRTRGGPFGLIVEEMFGVSPADVEKAWAEQFAGMVAHIDPRRAEIAPRVLGIISRRQAWQFRVLPLELREDSLVLCTTQEALVRALKFAGWKLGHSCEFVIAEPDALGEAMCRYYPMAGMTPSSISSPMVA